MAEEAIERDAEALLAEFSHARDVVIETPIPIEDIVEKHLKLRISLMICTFGTMFPDLLTAMLTFLARFTATEVYSSTKALIPMRIHRRKAAIVLLLRTSVAAIGDYTST